MRSKRLLKRRAETYNNFLWRDETATKEKKSHLLHAISTRHDKLIVRIFPFFSLSTENRGLLCKWRAHVSTAKWVKWFSSPKCCRIRSCICKKFHRAQLGIPSYICIARAVDQHKFFLPGRKRETNGFCFIVPTDVLRTWTAPPGIAISLEYITFDYRRSSADAQTMGFVTQNSVECGIEPLATIFPRGATENKIRKRRRRRRGLNGTRQTFTTVVFRVMGEYIVK